MNRRRLLTAALLATATVLTPISALAQSSDPASSYPNQLVRIVVPFSAGSMTDILARALAEKLTAKWKQQVIVENRSGIAGTANVAKGPADGHTIMLTSNGHAVISAMNRNLNFDPLNDFVGVTQVATMPSILVVPPDAPTRTLKDLIEAAKAKPGSLNYSSAGLGSATNIAAELLRQTARFEIVHVPYKGMPDAQTAIMRSDAAMGFTFFNVGGDLIQAGKMRAVAVTGTQRMAQLPDVPTFAEAGVPDFVYDAWFGILMPAATPKPIAAKIAQDIAEAVQAPGMKERFRSQGVELVSSSPATFDAVVRSDAERYAKLYRKTQGN
ncbi:Tripartite-type tricarboxylate transporter, receptor component TctC [Bosea sp. CRIB-10]|uniref:tripartite tricarboxylate transporter substrate binding protein n=1 Tax=Bosea sp. CRIB-10 TaxID=378404 RepID=UPI0008E1A42D|nr:tripartite tricarboxylate transporter substrate binding protein [Bosea sp. CRIB-10]SFB84430.1 Tripartite-type tricarboxylate transporter, receptor component TctC [Bosea sp. CRIB-10]